MPEKVVIARGQVNPVAEMSLAPPADGWDRWNDARSDYYAKAASYRYLPADVYGAAELDHTVRGARLPITARFGCRRWPAAWTPFSRGSWRWDPIYEWTWVDQAPWGWTTGPLWPLGDDRRLLGLGARTAHVACSLPAGDSGFYGDDGNVAVGISPLTAGVTWVALGWASRYCPGGDIANSVVTPGGVAGMDRAWSTTSSSSTTIVSIQARSTSAIAVPTLRMSVNGTKHSIGLEMRIAPIGPGTIIASIDRGRIVVPIDRAIIALSTSITGRLCKLRHR